MQIVVEAKLVWARQGKRITRKVRCTSGRKRGRVVSSAATCSKKIDMKKRIRFKRLKAKMKAKFAIKARRTKRFNPLAKRVAKLNKPKH